MADNDMPEEVPFPEAMRAASQAVSNWGRWGPDDQLGTLNYVTPEVVRRATELARTGQTFSLSLPLDAYGSQGASGFRRNPIHLMIVDGGDHDLDSRMDGWGGSSEMHVKRLWRGPMRFNDDFLMTPMQAGTQWDSLAHVYYEDKLYNGFPADSVTSFGATVDGIDRVAERGQVVTRGVLLDVARHRGVSYLEPLTAIEPAELEDVAEAQGVIVQSGDLVLVRTGWWQRFLETGDSATWGANAPGITWRCAEWLHDRQVAAIASDNHIVETAAIEFPGVRLPFHMLALRDMGMLIGELWDLEKLAAACETDRIYDFLVVAQPLLVPGAVGSPVNPVAIR